MGDIHLSGSLPTPPCPCPPLAGGGGWGAGGSGGVERLGLLFPLPSPPFWIALGAPGGQGLSEINAFQQLFHSYDSTDFNKQNPVWAVALVSSLVVWVLGDGGRVWRCIKNLW